MIILDSNLWVTEVPEGQSRPKVSKKFEVIGEMLNGIPNFDTSGIGDTFRYRGDGRDHDTPEKAAERFRVFLTRRRVEYAGKRLVFLKRNTTPARLFPRILKFLKK